MNPMSRSELSCILDVLRAARYLPLEVPEETILVVFVDARLKLTDESLDDSLPNLDPHALKAFTQVFSGAS